MILSLTNLIYKIISKAIERVIKLSSYITDSQGNRVPRYRESRHWVINHKVDMGCSNSQEIFTGVLQCI